MALDWSRIHREKRFGLWTIPLAIFSVLYGVGVRCRLAAYAAGMFRRKGLPGFVISVGNLTVGGTGKTPAVIMLARWAQKEGWRTAVLSRGYGGGSREHVLEVSSGNGGCVDVRTVGDEPALLAKAIPESPVVISRDRYAAGLYARNKFDSEFFILDDGFQHLKLERDFNLLLVDAANPFGNGHLLPWGPLREPLSQLRRADAVILTRYNREGSGVEGLQQEEEQRLREGEGEGGSEQKGDASPTQQILLWLKKRFPSIPVFYADHEPDKVTFPCSGAVYGPDFLKGKRVAAFAGIAQPEHFERTLKDLHANIVGFRKFGDHYPYKMKDLGELIHMKQETKADVLLTTEKDWMRIDAAAPGHMDLACLTIRFRLLPGQEGLFRMIRDGFRS